MVGWWGGGVVGWCFFQNPPRPLHVDVAGNLHRQIVAFVCPHRPSQGIGGIAGALLPARAIIRAGALPLAITLLHSLGQILGALAQRVERLALCVHGAIGITLAKLTAGIVHRAIGIAERIATVTLLLAAVLSILTLFALLALLAFLAALALLVHAAPGELLLQFVEPVAQALLILPQIAQVLVALLAVHPVVPGILALLERLVAQLLLLADDIAEFIHRLVHVIVAGLTGLRHLQIFQHRLELVEQLLGGILVARARQPFHALDHVVEILLTHDLGVGIERASQCLRIVPHLLFSELAQEIVEGRAQILG